MSICEGREMTTRFYFSTLLLSFVSLAARLLYDARSKRQMQCVSCFVVCDSELLSIALIEIYVANFGFFFFFVAWLTSTMEMAIFYYELAAKQTKNKTDPKNDNKYSVYRKSVKLYVASYVITTKGYFICLFAFYWNGNPQYCRFARNLMFSSSVCIIFDCVHISSRSLACTHIHTHTLTYGMLVQQRRWDAARVSRTNQTMRIHFSFQLKTS